MAKNPSTPRSAKKPVRWRVDFSAAGKRKRVVQDAPRLLALVGRHRGVPVTWRHFAAAPEIR